MARNKYRFKDRGQAEAELTRCEQTLTLHRITLDALLREEFTFTERFSCGNGSWFEMGFARATAAYGGIVLVKEYYPANQKPSQHAEWADTWIREMISFYVTCSPTDEEGRVYRNCLYRLRELLNIAQKEVA